MTITCCNRVLVTGLVVWSLTAAMVFGQSNQPMQESAARLAATLRKSGLKKVAVVPLAFVIDQSAEQKDRVFIKRDEEAPMSVARPALSGSRDSLLVAEQMQRCLSEAGEGELALVPSEDLFERLSKANKRTSELTPTGKELAGIVNPEGDIEAIVVGTVRKFHKEFVSPANGGKFLEPEQKSYEWSLIKLSDRTILDSKSIDSGYISLADAVYNGLSAEYFRYQSNGRLQCLLAYRQQDRKDLPLRPSDPEVLFDKDYSLNSAVHPLINPYCPFKVQFLVSDRVLPVYVATADSFFNRQTPKKSIFNCTLVNLEPGEDPVIRVSNTCSQRVMVAVFVDGVNILGKARELPDESCRAWVLDPNKKAEFKSWWTGDSSSPVQEEAFIIDAWEDSVAGRMGLPADSSSARAITIVFFTDGIPQRQYVQFFERRWIQEAFLPNASSNRVTVTEEMEPVGSAGAASSAFGFGAKPPKPGQLEWIQGARVGTILASMQVLYCPSSETKATLERHISSKNQWGKISGIVPVLTGP